MANIVDWLRTTISPVSPPVSKHTDNIEDGWELFEDISDVDEDKDTQSSIHTIEHIKLNKSTLSDSSSRKLAEAVAVVPNVKPAFAIPMSVIESTIQAINNSKIPEDTGKPMKSKDSLAHIKDKESKYRKLNKRRR